MQLSHLCSSSSTAHGACGKRGLCGDTGLRYWCVAARASILRLARFSNHRTVDTAGPSCKKKVVAVYREVLLCAPWPPATRYVRPEAERFAISLGTHIGHHRRKHVTQVSVVGQSVLARREV